MSVNLSISGLRVDAGSGPGSRGGKVIGHTSTGKAVYARHDHPAHKNFSSADHGDAARLQLERAEAKLKEAADLVGTSHARIVRHSRLTREALRHQHHVNMHKRAARLKGES